MASPMDITKLAKVNGMFQLWREFLRLKSNRNKHFSPLIYVYRFDVDLPTVGQGRAATDDDNESLFSH